MYARLRGRFWGGGGGGAAKGLCCLEHRRIYVVLACQFFVACSSSICHTCKRMAFATHAPLPLVSLSQGHELQSRAAELTGWPAKPFAIASTAILSSFILLAQGDAWNFLDGAIASINSPVEAFEVSLAACALLMHFILATTVLGPTSSINGMHIPHVIISRCCQTLAWGADRPDLMA